MSNITVNNVCQLKCPYCFNSFLKHPDAKHITEENFREICKFILSAKNPGRIGLIGGEPTIHPQFEKLIEIAIEEIGLEAEKRAALIEADEEKKKEFRENFEKSVKVMIFTNGVDLSGHINFLSSVKDRIAMLINVNPPEDTGETAYEKLKESLRLLKENGIDSFSLGINYYKKGYDTKFFEDLVALYERKEVRIGVPAPTSNDGNNFIDNILLIKDDLLNFITRLNSLGAKSHFDCQGIPICLLSKEELDRLSTCERKKGDLIKDSVCNPVIDFRQDLTAIRCFGLSGSFKPVSIKGFDTYDDLRGYFNRTYDCIAQYIPSSKRCTTCYLSKMGRCQAGCLTYKAKMVEKIQNVFEQSLGIDFTVEES